MTACTLCVVDKLLSTFFKVNALPEIPHVFGDDNLSEDVLHDGVKHGVVCEGLDQRFVAI